MRPFTYLTAIILVSILYIVNADECVRTEDMIFFRSNSADLSESGKAVIGRMIRFATVADRGAFRIVGHSSFTGDAEFSRMIGLKRARAVAEYIAASIDPKRYAIRIEYEEPTESDPLYLFREQRVDIVFTKTI